MEDLGEGGEVPRGFEAADKLLVDARSLGRRITAYAQLLADDSMAALKEVGSPFAEDDLCKDYWPLAGNSLQMTLASYARARLEHSENFPVIEGAEDTDPMPDTSLEGRKLDDSYLESVYGDVNPRARFSQDLISWAGAMAHKGWPIVVHIDFRESHRVEVTTYKATDAVREKFNLYSAIAEEEGRQPHRWLSESVVVSEDTEDFGREDAAAA